MLSRAMLSLVVLFALHSVAHAGFYDVDGGKDKGTEMVVQPCTATSPTFTFDKQTGADSLLRIDNTRLCMSPMRDSFDHFPINADSQCADSIFKLENNADGSVRVKSTRSDLCLERSIRVDVVEAGTPVLFFECRDVEEQKWKYSNSDRRLRSVDDQWCATTGHVYRDWQQACLPNSPTAQRPFCDTSLPVDARVEDLISDMSVEEKIDQLMHSAPSVPRLSLPAYNWWSESLHGVFAQADSQGRCPTNFPAVINLGQTFDKELFSAVGTAIGDEARALHHGGSAALLSTQFGLNVFSPNINIVRDPRWGRAQETPGEDPVLTGEYAARYIRGIQGDDPKYVKVAAVAKHFAVHSLESDPVVGFGSPYNGSQTQRWAFNAITTARDIQQTYLPAFRRAVVDGKAYGVMCSYNRINGVPACANSWLLQDTLRDSWGFDGFVVGDCNAVEQIYKGHRWNATEPAAAASALNAGTDNDCHVSDVSYRRFLAQAIQSGMTSIEKVNRSLRRLLRLRFSLGMFDPVAKVPYASIPKTVVASDAHKQLALRAARESIILLKNDRPTGTTAPLLPINLAAITTAKRVLLIGYLANATDALASVYSGELPHIVTIREALMDSKYQAKLQVTYTPFMTSVKDSSTATRDLINNNLANQARNADMVIAVLGIDRTVEREGIDRNTLELTGLQNRMVEILSQDNNIARKTIVVMVNGGSVDLTQIKAAFPAIIAVGYGGQSGGTAVADVLTGSYNPSGRLALTVYPKEFVTATVSASNQTPRNPWGSHIMRDGDGKTYRFYTQTPVYPFGHGLSYSRFTYTVVAPTPTAFSEAHPAQITVRVRNEGPMAGDQSVLAFLRATPASEDCPRSQLAAFDRVSLQVNESKIVSFNIKPSDSLCVDREGNPSTLRGQKFELTVGDATMQLSVYTAAEDQRYPTDFFDVDGPFEYVGQEVVLTPCSTSDNTQELQFSTSAAIGTIKFSSGPCVSPQRGNMQGGNDHFPLNADESCMTTDASREQIEAVFHYDQSNGYITVPNGRCLTANVPVDRVESGTPVVLFPCRDELRALQTWAVYRATATGPRRLVLSDGAPTAATLSSKMCLSTGHRYKDWQQTCQPESTAANADAKSMCNDQLSIDDRVEAVVSRLNRKQKIDLLMHTQPAIPELGLPAYNWWSEALHGVFAHADAQGRSPTNFPAVMNLGQTFDKELFTAVGRIVSDEARALHHAGANALLSSQYALNAFAPNINIVRDPRWGRAQETPGEDPVLTGEYAYRYIKAMQGSDDRYLKLVTFVKHYAVHSLESDPPVGNGSPYNGSQVQRWAFDAQTTLRDIHQTYLPAFKRAIVDAKSAGIMCSYNRINGVPACANELFLKNILRDSWGFDGAVVGDCNAVAQIYLGHRWTATPQAAAAAALKAGTDLDCHVSDHSYRYYLEQAIQEGLATEEDVNTAVRRSLKLRFRLGMFDATEKVPFFRISPAVVGASEHREVSLRAARESIVLLKNEAVQTRPALLPLSRFVANGATLDIALIGPMATATDLLSSVYAGQLPRIVSIEEALKSRARVNVNTVQALTNVKENKPASESFSAATAAASAADVAIVVIGNDRTVEREGVDRVTLTLPGSQLRLLQRVVAAQPNTILVLTTGGALDISWAKANVPAIVNIGYPGEESGTAVADVLFGDYNPSGRLALTFYPESALNNMDWASHRMRDGEGKTYRFYTGTPVYPFGAGLSYTTFTESITQSPATFSREDPATIRVRVRNTGDVAGDRVVMLYMAAVEPTVDCPLRQLVDFERVSLDADESQVVQFTIKPEDALCMDEQGFPVVRDQQEFYVMVGDYTATGNRRVTIKAAGSVEAGFCSSSPCKNGGTCDATNSRCVCPLNQFTGNFCQTRVVAQPCSSSPCRNGGSCFNNVNSYLCSCVNGYTGNMCQSIIVTPPVGSSCASNPCLGNNICTDTQWGTHTCSCKPGYNGLYCETDINECVSSPCMNGGSCIDGVNGYMCKCATDFNGTRCADKLAVDTALTSAGIFGVFAALIAAFGLCVCAVTKCCPLKGSDYAKTVTRMEMATATASATPYQAPPQTTANV